MNIIVDAMSGDHAPDEIVKGAQEAAAEYHINVILAGRESQIKESLDRQRLSGSRLEIADAASTVSMEDDYLVVVKSKKDSSMSVGLRLLKDGGGDAFVSAGNTGALVAGSTLILRRIKGVRAAALGAILPLGCPKLLIDSGANNAPSPEELLQFGVMGSLYMSRVFGLPAPRVALLNNGTEEQKGTALYREAHALLLGAAGIDFIGNVEGREAVGSGCDVIVADGFSGNVLLKALEGCGKYFSASLKNMLYQTPLTKLAALLLKREITKFRQTIDYTEYGGAPLLGVSRPVIKAHGNSGAKALKSAVRQAVDFSRAGVLDGIADALRPPADKQKETRGDAAATKQEPS